MHALQYLRALYGFSTLQQLYCFTVSEVFTVEYFFIRMYSIGKTQVNLENVVIKILSKDVSGKLTKATAYAMQGYTLAQNTATQTQIAVSITTFER